MMISLLSSDVVHDIATGHRTLDDPAHDKYDS
jgi:hypothetical protein